MASDQNKINNQLAERIRNLSDEKLIDMVQGRSGQYTPFALKTAQSELSRRGGKSNVAKRIEEKRRAEKYSAELAEQAQQHHHPKKKSLIIRLLVTIPLPIILFICMQGLSLFAPYREAEEYLKTNTWVIENIGYPENILIIGFALDSERIRYTLYISGDVGWTTSEIEVTSTDRGWSVSSATGIDHEEDLVDIHESSR